MRVCWVPAAGNPHNTFGMSKQVSGDEFLVNAAEEAAAADASASASQPTAASPGGKPALYQRHSRAQVA